jgi:hypothetical protein
MTDQRDPGAPPQRPTTFQASPRTPGLPQASLDPQRNQRYDGNGHADTPSGAIVASGKRIVDTVDSLGRRLKVKFLSPGDRMKLAKVIGGELAKNEVYLGYATLAWAVVELDNADGEDTRIYPMVKASEVEFLVERLGDEGLAAVGKVYQNEFADLLTGPDIDLAKN